MRARLPLFRSRGYSLIELILTLGIGSIIAMAVWSVFGERQVLVRATKQAQAVHSIFYQADRAYASSIEFTVGDGAGGVLPLNLERLSVAARGDLPAELIGDPGDFTNEWGGRWTLSTGSATGAFQDLAILETDQVPQSECRMMLQQVSPFIYDTYVNGSLVGLQLNEADSLYRNSLNFTQALPLCQGGNNTLRFRKIKDINLTELRRRRPFYGDLTEEERGDAVSERYKQDYLTHFNRIQAAMTSRENAQLALGN